MRASVVWLVVGICILGGCASSKAGYQKDGTFILDSKEQALDCDKLYKNIWGHVQIMKGLPAKAKSEQQSVASNASQMFKRWFGGGGSGLAAVQEYDRERAHVEALRRAMGAKGCMGVDVERELFQTEMAMAEFRSR